MSMKKKIGVLTTMMALIAAEESRVKGFIEKPTPYPDYDDAISPLVRFENPQHSKKTKQVIISTERPEVPKPNGVKMFVINDVKIWAINYKNALRKYNNLNKQS